MRAMDVATATPRQGLHPWLVNAAPGGAGEVTSLWKPRRGGTQEPGVKPLAIGGSLDA